ncbi:energy-coupling factor ABC transporter permease [Novosphingobium sp. M1R2S20]|uniref:Energy-coupling factor ABC transporter permease n=1 Tax=Novosphingobium rhizovicinum TaxID=3228928 RepID=A0ABV3REK2_9SPHN
MHIEPGFVAPGKIWLGYITAAAAGSYALKLAADAVKTNGSLSLAARCLVASALAFSFFQVLPHHPVGVSEVHLILGSTLFLGLGLAPTAIGLVVGLLVQGMFFAPSDLPQFGMNVTTLLVPLFGLSALARRIIAPDTPYVALGYSQTLTLSSTYQAGIVSWVAFWTFWGQGFTSASAASVATFGAAYMLVIIVEPLVDLAVLWGAKALHQLKGSGFVERRLYEAG